MPPHCPRCDTKLTFSRRVAIDDPTCAKCHSVLYLLVCVPIHAVFIVETTSRELHWLNEQQMTPVEVLEHFGASFPIFAG